MVWFLQFPHSELLHCLACTVNTTVEHFNLAASILQILFHWFSLSVCLWNIWVTPLQLNTQSIRVSSKRKTFRVLVSRKLHHYRNCDSTWRKRNFRNFFQQVTVGRKKWKHLNCLMPFHPSGMTHCLQLLPLLFYKSWLYPAFKSQLPFGWVAKEAWDWVSYWHHVTHFPQIIALYHAKFSMLAAQCMG